jgi:hypothetical protein
LDSEEQAARALGPAGQAEMDSLCRALDASYYAGAKARARQLAKCERVCKAWHDRLKDESRYFCLSSSLFSSMFAFN